MKIKNIKTKIACEVLKNIKIDHNYKIYVYFAKWNSLIEQNKHNW